MKQFLEQDLEEGLLTESECRNLLEVYLVSFVNFIKVLDDCLVKGKRLKRAGSIRPRIEIQSRLSPC